MIEKFYMQYKQQTINTIKKIDPSSERKNDWMKLKSDATYRYMLTNIDISSAAINTENTVEVKPYPQRLGESPESWDHPGIIYLLERNNGLARKYFRKNINSRDINAIRNMEKLNSLEKIP